MLSLLWCVRRSRFLHQVPLLQRSLYKRTGLLKAALKPNQRAQTLLQGGQRSKRMAHILLVEKPSMKRTFHCNFRCTFLASPPPPSPTNPPCRYLSVRLRAYKNHILMAEGRVNATQRGNLQVLTESARGSRSIDTSL